MKLNLTKSFLAILFATSFLYSGFAQSDTPIEGTRAIEFPDIPGYVTLKCDLHMHTVFSDGSVWPDIRVQEAVRDGLDAIAITDHIEYQPKKNDIPHTDRNRGYELALESAKETGLLVINSTEITRSMPTGHFNAIFVKDVNKLDQKDVVEVFREAKQQGAFVFWNHPHWTAQKPDGVAALTQMHKDLLAEGLFAGIEVYNHTTYSDEALEIASEHKLTIMGNSDMHNLIDWGYNVPEGGHRPVTLVFATEKSVAAMQNALEERRTAVWFENTLVGDSQYLTPMVEQSLEVTRAGKGPVPSVLIHNHSDADYILENLSEFRLHNQAKVFILKAHESTTIQVKTVETLDSFELRFSVLNAFSTPDTHPEIKLVVE
ncbi:MAG: PHP domain-containing protein [Bacteroidales bacterium]|nr:PHP domain-containing protein [Bacteroidales bacterium]